MRFFFLLLILCIICFNTNPVSAWEKTLITKSFDIPNEHITQAKLLDSYIIRYAKNIDDSSRKIQIENHIFIRDTYTELRNMKVLLQKIKNKEMPEKQSENTLKGIVQSLKSRNTRLQNFFSEQNTIYEQKLEKQKAKYTKFSRSLSTAIEGFISKLTSSLLQKKNYSKSEKSIARLLLKLRDENKKLKDFSGKSFHTEQDMKYYLRKRIENIRWLISDIKNAIR